MKKIIPLLLVCLLMQTCVSAQESCTTKRYIDPDFFKVSDIQLYDSVVYGNALGKDGKTVALDMGIARPKAHSDRIKIHPLIVLIHGGGFNFGAKSQFYSMAIMLARRGFVVASINYRLGWNFTPAVDKKWDSTFDMAVYRAVQDTKAALRYLVAMAAGYGIDTSRIFVGGASAGATAAIKVAYYTQADWDKSKPWLEWILCSTDSAANTFKSRVDIKGVIDMWGDIADTADISAAKAKHVPILMFQGDKDLLVPYTKAGPPDHPEMVNPGEGAYLIALRYKHLGGCYQLNTKLNGGHGDDFSDEFICDKIGSFCKSIFCGTCKQEEFSTTWKKK